MLGAGRKIVHVTEKSHQLPGLLFAYDIFPGGHRRPADAVLQNVKIMIFRHVGHVIHELGCRWIEGVGERGFGIRGVTVTKRTVVAIEESSGDEVRLVGFGTFSVASRAASEGRNPRTGEKIQIAASKQAKFKPGKGLRDSLN